MNVEGLVIIVDVEGLVDIVDMDVLACIVGADSLVFMGLASFTLDPINLAGSCLF
jgi:hypothetical protein